MDPSRWRALVEQHATEEGILDKTVDHSTTWRLSCGVHSRHLLIKSVRSKSHLLTCGYCHSTGTECKQPSSHEKLVNEVLCQALKHQGYQVGPGGADGMVTLHVETKVLQPLKSFGPTDFYLPEFKLIIQVDGSGHFENPHRARRMGRQGVPSRKAQWEVDSSFNAAALEQGYRVLRVHYKDAEDSLLAKVCNVLEMCKQGRLGASILFTRSFKKEDIFAP